LPCYDTALRLYEDTNFSGKILCFVGEGIANLDNYRRSGFPFYRSWNDAVSSFRTPNLASVTLYKDRNASGVRMRFSADWDYETMPPYWNDVVSSVCIPGWNTTCP